MALYTKRPVSVEACQWTGENYEEIMDWGATFGEQFAQSFSPIGGGLAIISTPEGQMIASAGDWIIRGVKGEYCACKPDIFDLTYVEGNPDDPAPAPPVDAKVVGRLNMGPNGFIYSITFDNAVEALAEGVHDVRVLA